MNTIKDYFIEKINQKYFVTENLARFLFDRWKIDSKCLSNVDIDNFLNSKMVSKVFFITPDINIAKNYSVDELGKLGIKLNVVIDADKRIFKDDKYGFIWQEQFHGHADAYIGLYKIIEPVPVDDDLCK